LEAEKKHESKVFLFFVVKKTLLPLKICYKKKQENQSCHNFFYHHGVDHFVAELNAWKK
jgi:hypothetical protein